jgi:MFS family permease
MPTRDRGLGAVLLAIGVGWGAGNVGPVVTPLAHAFHTSLTGVGLLSGTVYFAAILIGTPLAVPLTTRTGAVRATAVAAVTMALGNALFALGPGFGGLVAARVLVGAGTAVSLIAGPVMARELGGVRLLGLFGGGITLGIAVALGLGSVLADAGVDWQVGFVISAAVCLAPLPALPKRVAGAPAPRPDLAFLRKAVRTATIWRLLALFVAANGVPLIVGAWLVAYLVREAHLRTALAGALAFVVFGLTTVARPIGARLAARGRSFAILAGGGCAVGAGGLLALAASRSLPLALVAVALMGVGFAMPYAAMLDAAQRVFPEQPTATLAILQTGPNVVPMIVIPLVGSALARGNAPTAFVVLAAFVAVAGAVNLTRSPRMVLDAR